MGRYAFKKEKIKEQVAEVDISPLFMCYSFFFRGTNLQGNALCYSKRLGIEKRQIIVELLGLV